MLLTYLYKTPLVRSCFGRRPADKVNQNICIRDKPLSSSSCAPPSQLVLPQTVDCAALGCICLATQGAMGCPRADFPRLDPAAQRSSLRLSYHKTEDRSASAQPPRALRRPCARQGPESGHHTQPPAAVHSAVPPCPLTPKRPRHARRWTRGRWRVPTAPGKP
ncbi:hypothetical protein BD413DRAFT_37626 [Trametes elegans]|nr:hypothetical protein BD413DRAFT_37626 [Trametes elegans]